MSTLIIVIDYLTCQNSGLSNLAVFASPSLCHSEGSQRLKNLVQGKLREEIPLSPPLVKGEYKGDCFVATLLATTDSVTLFSA